MKFNESPVVIPSNNRPIDNLTEAYHILLASEISRLSCTPIRRSEPNSQAIMRKYDLPNSTYANDLKSFNDIFQLPNAAIPFFNIPQLTIDKKGKVNEMQVTLPLAHFLYEVLDRQKFLYNALSERNKNAYPYKIPKTEQDFQSTLEHHKAIRDSVDNELKQLRQITAHLYTNNIGFIGKYDPKKDGINMHARILGTLAKYGITTDQQIHSIAAQVLQRDEFQTVSNLPFDPDNAFQNLTRLINLIELEKSGKFSNIQQTSSQVNQTKSIAPQTAPRQQNLQATPQQRFNESAKEITNITNIINALKNSETIMDNSKKSVSYGVGKIIEASFALQKDLVNTEWSGLHTIHSGLEKDLKLALEDTKKDYEKIAKLREKITICQSLSGCTADFPTFQDACKESGITRICSAKRLTEIFDSYKDVIKANPKIAEQIKNSNAFAIKNAESIQNDFTRKPDIENIQKKAANNNNVKYMLNASKKFGVDMVNLTIQDIISIFNQRKSECDSLIANKAPDAPDVEAKNTEINKLYEIVTLLHDPKPENKIECVKIDLDGDRLITYKDSKTWIKNTLEAYQVICREEGVPSMPWSEVSKLVEPSTKLTGANTTPVVTQNNISI